MQQLLRSWILAGCFAALSPPAGLLIGAETAPEKRPNILFAISDDQSYPYASAYGTPGISTPAFDRVARDGVLFENAFAPSPGCSPSRAAMLTGRYPWQIEQAGTHASEFPIKYICYPDLLERAGYFAGYTGKGWGPGNWQESGRTRNPAGNEFSSRKQTDPPQGIAGTDYAGNFEDFLKQKTDGQPFFFWYGATEPHRPFQEGIGKISGRKLEDAFVPSFLPDTPEIRSDILDYCAEIEWFDQHLERMLTMLEERGEIANTIVAVTSDNGMAFPRAKANLYEFGFHMPLAISWPGKIPGGRKVTDIISLIDLAPTFLEAAGVSPVLEFPMTGRSLAQTLYSTAQGQVDPSRTAAYSARERHSSARWNNLSYPQRCIRTEDYLFIRNFRPERWPAGAPRKFGDGNYPADETKLGPWHGGYHDIDACPSLTFLIEQRDHPELGRFLILAVERRPAEELFDIRKDPACLENLAARPEFESARTRLATQLESFLRETGDPRVIDGGEVFETYKRYSEIRKFPEPEWAKEKVGVEAKPPVP